MARTLDIRPRQVKKQPRPKPKPAGKPAASRPWRKTIAASAGAALLLLAVFAFLVLPEVKIEVEARSEPVTREFEIKVDQKAPSANFAELVTPGKVLEQDLSGTKTFPATGTKNAGKIASGFVHIYNFSKTTLILKKDTTILIANGNKYHFTQDAGNIRPTARIGLEDQEVDPTSLTAPVPVAAEGPGEQFNLPAKTRLEIQNEVFGHQPKVLYAVVAEDLSGGTTREMKVVTQEDIQRAYDDLGKQLLENSRKALATPSSSFKILDEAASSQIVEQKAAAAPGAESKEFDATVRLKLRALVYDEQEVRGIITQRITRLLPENKILQTRQADRLQSKFSAVNLDQGFGILQNHYESQIVYKVDPADLVERVRGKSESEIRDILLSRPEIAEVGVKFYPFWVKSAPKFTRKIFFRVKSPS